MKVPSCTRSNSRTPSFAPFASIASQRGDRRSKKAACQGLSIGDGMKRERSLWSTAPPAAQRSSPSKPALLTSPS
jgi:hypothetical protein